MLAQEAAEEVFKARRSSLTGWLISNFLLRGLIGGGRFSSTQAAVVVELRVAVGVREDYSILARLWCLDARGFGEPATVGVKGMAEGLRWSLDLRLGLGAGLQRRAVFVIVNKAVVALLGLAADSEVVANLVDRFD